MFAFLRGFFGGGAASKADRENIAAALSDGLDVGAAITAHENWKTRLDAYLAGTSKEELRPEVICLDDRCDLGKWIHSTGQARLGKYPGFSALKMYHKQFHFAASNVVQLAQRGDRAEAETLLKGPYTAASRQVVGALSELRQTVEQI